MQAAAFMQKNRFPFLLSPVALVLLMGVITTVFYYRFAIHDQIEQLPLMLRFMEGDYLERDFFTNAGENFGPRFYYAQLMAGSGKLLGLKTALFVWTLLAQVSLAWVSFQMGKQWHGGDQRAGLMAAAVAMSAEAVAWGSNAVIYAQYLAPDLLAMPLISMSLLAGSQGRLMRAGLWAGLASGVHVLLGLETGALVLVAGGWIGLRQQGLQHRPTWRQAILGALVLAAAALPTLIPYAQQEQGLDAAAFYQVVAAFRHPHHYLPSYFLANGWELLKGGAFWGAMGLAWARWRRHQPAQARAQPFVAVLAALIALGCLIGWLGVEVVPNRLVITAQTRRLLNLLKWIGLVLIGGGLGRMTQAMGVAGSMGSLLSMLTPFSMLGLMGKAAGLRIPLAGIALLGLLTAGLLLAVDQLFWSSVGLVGLYAGVVGVYVGGKRRWGMAIAGALILGAGINATLLAGRLPQPLELIASQAFRPKVYAWSYPEAMQQVMDFARTQTPAGSLWLTPPDFGPMRIAGRRAIVVDFKAFPFQDPAILTWHERILACYGADLEALEETWRKWDPATLRRLGQQYAFDYAIVPNTTTWRQHPGLFQNKAYKVLSRGDALAAKKPAL